MEWSLFSDEYTMTESHCILVDDVLHICLRFLCWKSISKLLLVSKQFYRVGIYEIKVDYIRFIRNYLESKNQLRPSFDRTLRIPAGLKRVMNEQCKCVSWKNMHHTRIPLRPVVSSIVKELLKCDYMFEFHSDAFTDYLSSIVYSDYRVFQGKTDYPKLRTLAKRKITKNKWTLKRKRSNWYTDVAYSQEDCELQFNPHTKVPQDNSINIDTLMKIHSKMKRFKFT